MLESVWIDGLDYKIGLSPSTVNDDHGRVTYRTCEVWVDETMPEAKRYEILLHEVLHVLDNNRGLRLKEDQVKAMANALFAFLRDNPAYLARLVTLSEKGSKR